MFVKKLLAVAVTASSLVLVGCGGDSSTSATSTSVAGTASKGIMSNAKVEVFRVDTDESLGETRTNAVGGYTLDIGSYSGPVYVEVTADANTSIVCDFVDTTKCVGNIDDDLDGDTVIDFGDSFVPTNSFSLKSINPAPSSQPTTNVTPLTTVVSGMVLASGVSSSEIESYTKLASANVANSMGLDVGEYVTDLAAMPVIDITKEIDPTDSDVIAAIAAVTMVEQALANGSVDIVNAITNLESAAEATDPYDTSSSFMKQAENIVPSLPINNFNTIIKVPAGVVANITAPTIVKTTEIDSSTYTTDNITKVENFVAELDALVDVAETTDGKLALFQDKIDTIMPTAANGNVDTALQNLMDVSQAIADSVDLDFVSGSEVVGDFTVESADGETFKVDATDPETGAAVYVEAKLVDSSPEPTATSETIKAKLTVVKATSSYNDVEVVVDAGSYIDVSAKDETVSDSTLKGTVDYAKLNLGVTISVVDDSDVTLADFVGKLTANLDDWVETEVNVVVGTDSLETKVATADVNLTGDFTVYNSTDGDSTVGASLDLLLTNLWEKDTYEPSGNWTVFSNTDNLVSSDDNGFAKIDATIKFTSDMGGLSADPMDVTLNLDRNVADSGTLAVTIDYTVDSTKKALTAKFPLVFDADTDSVESVGYANIEISDKSGVLMSLKETGDGSITIAGVRYAALTEVSGGIEVAYVKALAETADTEKGIAVGDIVAAGSYGSTATTTVISTL